MSKYVRLGARIRGGVSLDGYAKDHDSSDGFHTTEETLAMGSTQQKIEILSKYHYDFTDECGALEMKYQRRLPVSRERLEQFRSIIDAMEERLNRERFRVHDSDYSSDSEPEIFNQGPDMLR